MAKYRVKSASRHGIKACTELGAKSSNDKFSLIQEGAHMSEAEQTAAIGLNSLLEEVTGKLSACYPKAVLLFGSAVAFLENPDANPVPNDLDILLVTDNPLLDITLEGLGNYRRAYGVTTTAKKLASQKADKKSAWLIAGQIEFEWQEFDSAEKSFQHALTFMDKTDPEYKKVTEKEALAVYRQGEQSRARGDLKSAVQHFNRVKVVMPGTASVTYSF